MGGALSASVPRRITQIYISDVNWFIDWDDLVALNGDESASESGSEHDNKADPSSHHADLEGGYSQREWRSKPEAGYIQGECISKPEEHDDFAKLLIALPTPSRSDKLHKYSQILELEGSLPVPAESTPLPPTCTS